MSRTMCACPDNNCLLGTCDCLIRNALCCSGCNCGGDCQKDLSLGTINPTAAQGTTPTLASGSSANQAAAAQAAADQSAAAQAAAQPQPKPLQAQEPESKGEARNSSLSAVQMKFIDHGCSCRKNQCQHYRCLCFMRKVRCTSKCKCRATVCMNTFGAKGDESNAQLGGQQGTSGTPDEAVLEQESQIVQPRDTSSLVSTMSERRCGCTNKDCFQSCVCYKRNVLCPPDCKCYGHCLHSVVIRWSATQGTTPTLASGSSTAQGTSQMQPLILISSAAQAAAQTLPSNSVVAALVPDTKTKALPAQEPGSTQKPCRCDGFKCENINCTCVRAGLPCCDQCECKDCDNTKTSKEKLQDRGIKREVPASGSGTSTMTAGAALAAKESAVGCNCQSECASGCGCVKRNIRCTSVCKCKPRCGNDDGSRFPKSKAGSGGQGGTRSSSSSRAVEPAGKQTKRGG